MRRTGFADRMPGRPSRPAPGTNAQIRHDDRNQFIAISLTTPKCPTRKRKEDDIKIQKYVS